MRTLLAITAALLLLAGSGCSDDDNTDLDQGVDLAVADLAPLADLGTDTTQVDTQPPLDQGVADAKVFLDAPPTEGGMGVDLGITCTSTLGTATASGTVQGQPVVVSTAGGVTANVQGLVGYGIALLNQSGTCAAVASTMSAPKVWILLCGNQPGSYSIGASCSGGVSLQNSATIPSTGTDPVATSGTVTITSFDSSCGGTVKGSFSLSFSGQMVTGSFDTVGCGTVNL